MEIYIAVFAGLLSSLLLAVVYLADCYEREPLELIQDSFLTGVAGQLVLVLAVSATSGWLEWSGSWLLLTVGLAAAYLPFRLHRLAEMDERFDGIVYSVALVGGALCVIHLNNLPVLVAESPYRDVLASGAEPDLRDLLILASWPGVGAEFGRGLVVLVAAVLAGAVLGALQMRGWRPWRTAAVVVVVGVAVIGLDLAAGGAGWLRWALTLAALAVAAAVKRRSVFRDRPQPAERDLLVLGVKTVLVVLGAALLATVVLRLAVVQPASGDAIMGGDRHTLGAGEAPGS